MTEKDVIKLFAILTAAYPKFDTLGDLEKAKPVVKLWAEMLADIPYEAAEAAVKKFILESPYPPTIADIRRQVAEIMQDPDDNIDAATAWGEVVRALNHYGYYRPEEALASMSPRTAKIVRLMGWQNICMSEDPAVIRGQFLKMYEIYTQREKQEALLPQKLKQTIRQIAEGRKLELIEGGRKAGTSQVAFKPYKVGYGDTYWAIAKQLQKWLAAPKANGKAVLRRGGRVLTHFSLFSGIGGIDLAAEWAGFKTVGQCEIADYPYKVLCKHWPDVPKWRDIKDVTAEDVYRRTGLRTVDLISGGFPCQPFSNAGKRRGKADDRYLWPEMLRVIQELRPTWVLGENVAGIVSLALDEVLSDLEGQGYETQAFIIPACAVGALHRRDRVFIVAHSSSKRLQRGQKTTSLEESNEQLSRLLQTDLGPYISESQANRNNYGIPCWMDRLKCLGEAVVPQQVYPILKAIADIENAIREGEYGFNS